MNEKRTPEEKEAELKADYPLLYGIANQSPVVHRLITTYLSCDVPISVLMDSTVYSLIVANIASSKALYQQIFTEPTLPYEEVAKIMNTSGKAIRSVVQGMDIIKNSKTYQGKPFKLPNNEY